MLKNDSMFFIIDGAKEAVITSKYVTHSITICPNIPIILNNRQFLLKEKYVEEHITIYNKKKLSDKCWISLRVSFGSLEDFNSAPGPQVQYPYSVLEVVIVNFLREFSIFWSNALNEQRKKSKNTKLTVKIKTKYSFGKRLMLPFFFFFLFCFSFQTGLQVQMLGKLMMDPFFSLSNTSWMN